MNRGRRNRLLTETQEKLRDTCLLILLGPVILTVALKHNLVLHCHPPAWNFYQAFLVPLLPWTNSGKVP